MKANPNDIQSGIIRKLPFPTQADIILHKMTEYRSVQILEKWNMISNNEFLIQ